MIWQMRVVILAAWATVAVAVAALGYVAATAEISWLLWGILLIGFLALTCAVLSFNISLRELYGPHLLRQIFGRRKSGADNGA